MDNFKKVVLSEALKNVKINQGLVHEAVVAYNKALQELNTNSIYSTQLTQYANLITLKRNDLLEAGALK